MSNDSHGPQLETRLSAIDGTAGMLTIAGMDVAEAAEQPLSELAAALWTLASSPTAASWHAEGVERAWGEARQQAFALLARQPGVLELEAMDALRAAVARLPASGDLSADVVAVSGAVAVYAAAWMRRERGAAPVPPDPSLSHTHDFLRMLSGDEPGERRVAGMSRYLACVCEHGMNASTFAARTVASTESDVVSAVVAGIGALKGRLHGGAPGPVLEMLDAIGRAEAAGPWIAERLQRRERIMGMGHRVYRSRDPRATVLERALRELDDVDEARLDLARAVEAEAERQLAVRHPARSLRANVEFFTAVLLEALDIPRAAFTATFAVGRVVGWCGHVLEQRHHGRLIRPHSRYIGPARVA